MPTFISAFGDCKTVLEWTRDSRCAVSLMTLLNRHRNGWDGEAALTTPSAAPADRWRRLVEAFGETKSILDWEQDERAQVSATEILNRLRQSWQPEEAITKPVPDVSETSSRAPSRLYHGKTITEWLADPRCRVSRFTLERNLRALMPLEEALVYRKRGGAAPEASPAVESLDEALRLLNNYGELWHYIGQSESRTSILHDNQRYHVEPDVFTKLRDSFLVRSVFKSETVEQYTLSVDGRKAAQAAASRSREGAEA